MQSNFPNEHNKDSEGSEDVGKSVCQNGQTLSQVVHELTNKISDCYQEAAEKIFGTMKRKDGKRVYERASKHQFDQHFYLNSSMLGQASYYILQSVLSFKVSVEDCDTSDLQNISNSDRLMLTCMFGDWCEHNWKVLIEKIGAQIDDSVHNRRTFGGDKCNDN